mgnify:CR=1 FL=1
MTDANFCTSGDTDRLRIPPHTGSKEIDIIMVASLYS